MTAKRTRLMIDGDQVLALKEQVILRYEPIRKAWVLVAPEHVYWPDETALEILQKVDGKNSVREMIATFAATYDAPYEEIAGDVLGFLQEWADRRLIGLAADA